MADCTFTLVTPPGPGAIAIVQLCADVDALLPKITGRDDWPTGRARLCSIAGIDDGIVAKITDDIAQLMPHGGPRVVQRIAARLIELGARQSSLNELDPQKLYPEAADRYEALALRALARATSPLAIDLLLAQPSRWRSNPDLTAEDHQRSTRLNRLIDPPLVVLAGPPNVGKSTLSNTLLGRSMSIEADLPGTTRDYTAARINLAGLVVTWHDTPGLQETTDTIEAEAITLARRLQERADLLIAITDNHHDWPTLPRRADLQVAARADLGAREDADLLVSARTGRGVAELVQKLRTLLVPPGDLNHPGPWVFDTRLQL